MTLRHYLDSASAAPLRAVARDAMRQGLLLPNADPSRLHHDALEVRAHLEHARELVASFVHSRASEVVFTSSATEAIATAVRGALAKGGPGTVVVGCAVEHSAVREAAGENFRSVPVSREGLLDVDAFAELLDREPLIALAACQLGNHEMGAVQPVAEVAALCSSHGVMLLVDAAQAAPWTPLDFLTIGADFMALSGPKLGGPPGTGALIVRRGKRIPPLLAGGAQERGRRAGMENTPGALGLAAACEELEQTHDREHALARQLTDRLRAGLSGIDGVMIYGPQDPDRRLPHLVCCGIDRVEPQAVLLELDRRGIAGHSGSACASEDLEPSPVLAAMGVDAHRSLRFSVHAQSTTDDIDAVIHELPTILATLRTLA
ncbi:MAG: aminotransferase class V-fold PLP-dependent enzyme [Acidimicrobiales bacterium]|nr:aminotransferase class V-fold PLP-dependent enzyme [Acidimicrobiales bacterium]